VEWLVKQANGVNLEQDWTKTGLDKRKKVREAVVRQMDKAGRKLSRNEHNSAAISLPLRYLTGPFFLAGKEGATGPGAASGVLADELNARLRAGCPVHVTSKLTWRKSPTDNSTTRRITPDSNRGANAAS